MNETKTGFLRAAITLVGAAAFGPVAHGATLQPLPSRTGIRNVRLEEVAP